MAGAQEFIGGQLGQPLDLGLASFQGMEKVPGNEHAEETGNSQGAFLNTNDLALSITLPPDNAHHSQRGFLLSVEQPFHGRQLERLVVGNASRRGIGRDQHQERGQSAEGQP